MMIRENIIRHMTEDGTGEDIVTGTGYMRKCIFI